MSYTFVGTIWRFVAAKVKMPGLAARDARVRKRVPLLFEMAAASVRHLHGALCDRTASNSVVALDVDLRASVTGR
jgi:hypothetical protein